MLRASIDFASRALGLLLILSGIGGVAFATDVPEIDPASAASAIALLSGAVLVARDKIRQR